MRCSLTRLANPALTTALALALALTLLQVGKVSADFGAAFYAYNPKTYRLDKARVTTLLRGTAHGEP